MQIKFAANLINLKLPVKDLDIGKLKISSPIDFNALDFLGIEFTRAFGVQGMHRMSNGWAVAYDSLDIEIDGADLNKSQEVFNVGHDSFRQALLNFVNFLWFAKDSCVYVQTIYGLTTRENQSVGYGAFNLFSIYSRSDGSFNESEFTESEVRITESIRVKFFEICPKYNTSHDVLDYGGSNRIEKAFLFVRSAREVHLLSAKMAMYMSALECLFSGDPGELTQKISSRVAYYIGSDKAERIKIFDDVKAAYEIRSSYLHGGSYKSKHLKEGFQSDLTPKIDDIVRRVLTKVIMTDSEIFLPASDLATGEEKALKRGQFETFLKELIFQ